MALPSSGTISLNDLQTEFGGSNPIEISEYYRGGALVPNITVNNAVPTSGQISLSNFYNASKADVIPDAFNVTNIAISGFDLISGNSNTVTITGINTPITLNIGTTTANIQASGSEPFVILDLEVFVNSVSANSVSWTRGSAGSTTNITRNMKVTVSNNDTLYFNFSVDVTQSGVSGDGGGTVSAITWTISNDSSANTSLDTFTTSGSASLS